MTAKVRGPWLALGLLAVVLAGGTTGYVVIERWSAWDAFYMTVTTVSTVGYREVHPLSFAGQVFTTGLILAGVGTLFYNLTLLVTLIVEGGLPRHLQYRRYARMLDQLKNHFIVCGYGRIGSIVAREFQRQKVPFVVVDRDPGRYQQAIEDGVLAVDADATREDVLTRVGIHRARGLIAAVGTDAENVYTILSARVLRPDLFIIGRAESEEATRKVLRSGANRVISPYQIGGQQMAQTALRPAVVDFVALATSSENLELAMEQVLVAAHSGLAGKSIVDAGLRQRFGVVVVGIQRPDGKMEFNPAPSEVIQAGDKLVVLGRGDSLRQLESEAGKQ
ncbi:MAG: potassium channel protein [Acidobacteriota bacterium]|nr:potassium channel protein [Acidobacteriota bacterium]